MKQIFIIESKKRITADELLGCLEDTIGNNFISSINSISPTDINAEMVGILDYIEDDFLCEGCTDINCSIADYFDFKNRTCRVSKSETDWIKLNLSKNMQRKILDKVF